MNCNNCSGREDQIDIGEENQKVSYRVRGQQRSFWRTGVSAGPAGAHVGVFCSMTGHEREEPEQPSNRWVLREPSLVEEGSQLSSAPPEEWSNQWWTLKGGWFHLSPWYRGPRQSGKLALEKQKQRPDGYLVRMFYNGFFIPLKNPLFSEASWDA